MIFQLKREQILHANIDEVWEFASSPENLPKITPKYMNFTITSKKLPKKMYQGMLIMYKVSPVLGIPTTWLAEITQIEEKKFFIDEQKIGPYSLWHHQHFFEPCEGGVIMKDIVTYKLPFGLFGRFLHWLFIKRKLNNIFNYRFQKMDKIFNK
tara:strand:+ start:693 stop:1151 length:459 start_codon:yes stop_codon:yes gene_type:complete